MALKKIFLNGMLWSFIQQFSNQLITFGIQLVLVRFISPTDFGLIGMLAVFIGIATALIDGGMTSSLIRNNQVDNSDYSTIFYYNVFFSVIIYFIFFILAPYIGKFYNQQALEKIARIYGLTLIFSSFGAVHNIILFKKMEFRKQAIITLPPMFLGGTLGILLAVKNYGVWSIVYSMLASSLLTSFSLWFFSNWKPSLIFDIDKFKLHFYYGYKMSISSALDNLFTNIYPILIGKLYNPAAVGYYTRANSLMMLPVGNFSIILNRVVFPLFSKVQDDVFSLQRIFKKIMQIFFYVLAPTTALMILLSKEIVLVLFTDKWLQIIPIFRILCFVGLLYPLHLYNLMILQVKGKSALFLKLELIKKVIIIISLFISVKFGFLGILIGSVIASIITLPINTYYAGKLINYKMFQQLKDLFSIFVLTIIMSVIIFFFKELISDYSNSIKILFCSILAAFLYISISLVFKIQSAIEILLIVKKYLKSSKKVVL
jgi:O-antigen/teichoic acid export membrane protein